MYLGRIVEIGPATRCTLPAPPVHRRAAVGRAGRRPGARATSAAAQRRRAEPGEPAERVPLPHALPEGAGALLDRGPAARGQGHGHGAACHFPLTARRSPRSAYDLRDERQRLTPRRREAAGAAARADPLRHGQPARQRARRRRSTSPTISARRASSASCSAPSPSGPNLRGAAARRGARRRARRSATSATSTRCSRTPPSGRTTRGRATSPTATCGAAGALDMKSQVAAEIAAAASLARSGWRPARGELLIVAVVDEETGGVARRAVDHRDAPREGALRPARQRGRRRACSSTAARAATACAARRRASSASRVTTDGVAGHASMPSMGENALLKMAPVLERLGARQPSYELTDEPRAFLRGIGEDPDDPERVDRAAARGRPAPGDDVRADARRHVHADADQRVGEDQRDPQPRRAEGRLPRAARARARRRCARRSPRCSGLRTGFADRVHRAGRRQPLADDLAADGRDLGVDRRARSRRARGAGDPARASPTRATSAWRSPSASPTGSSPTATSRCWRRAPLVHGADERIDVRDLAFATEFFSDLARRRSADSRRRSTSAHDSA